MVLSVSEFVRMETKYIVKQKQNKPRKTAIHKALQKQQTTANETKQIKKFENEIENKKKYTAYE